MLRSFDWMQNGHKTNERMKATAHAVGCMWLNKRRLCHYKMYTFRATLHLSSFNEAMPLNLSHTNSNKHLEVESNKFLKLFILL